MKQLFNSIDKVLLFSCITLFLIGLLMIISASSTVTLLRYESDDIFKFGLQQLFFIVAGSFFSYIFILRKPIRKQLKWASPILILIIILLGYVWLNGNVTNNARSWIPFFGFSLQPSEFAKPAIILYLAFIFQKINKKHISNQQISMIFAPVIISIMMIILQPDYGTAAIIILIVSSILLIIPEKTGLKNKIFMFLIGAFILFAMTLPFAGQSILSKEQQNRIIGYTDPCKDYYNEGLQVCNSLIAINNSNGFGVGLNKSTQKHLYLPESYTDFIMAITIEELGIGIFTLIMVLYILIISRLIIIAKRSNHVSGAIIAYGTAAYIFIHIFINLGGISALIPLTGVPLPFLSYGGSYTASLIIALAMSLRVSHDNKVGSVM